MMSQHLCLFFGLRAIDGSFVRQLLAASSPNERYGCGQRIEIQNDMGFSANGTLLVIRFHNVAIAALVLIQGKSMRRHS
jgi:hypothetical protein